MFGYVLPNRDRLTSEENKRFQSVYCGLCHTLGKRYGLAGRMILNYDLTFLALLLQEGHEAFCKKRCPVHPLRKRSCVCENLSLSIAADMSVILTWWQVQDGIADYSSWKSIKYRLAALLLRRAYQKAKLAQPQFDMRTKDHLEELSAFEQANEPSLDRPADTFARLLAGVSQSTADPVKQRVLNTMLYHLGRWIYLIDAADDLKKDMQNGSYNPLPLRYGLNGDGLTQGAKAQLAETLDASIRVMASAFELWDFGDNAPILRAVVYDGLYAVGAQVLSGTFHHKKRNPMKARG